MVVAHQTMNIHVLRYDTIQIMVTTEYARIYVMNITDCHFNTLRNSSNKGVFTIEDI
jgi:hypothetical protein